VLQRGGHGGMGEEEELTAIVSLDEKETAMMGLAEEKKKEDEANARGERVFFLRL
jgi:hypothetical protein